MKPFQENILLRDHCTLGIGGPARYLCEVRTIDEMQEVIRYCATQKLPFLVLGKGSNCLFDDRGFNGVVIVNKINFFEEVSPGVFHVGAGYSFARLGVQTARQGWGGLEFASGIPASVGGAVFMNAGANTTETCETVECVEFVSKEGDLMLFQREALKFSYRSSPFQHMSGAIVGVTFKLNESPEARQKQIAIVTKRSKTQPYSAKSAGCIFLNPSCCSAGELIDRCQLKGTRIGGAAVSDLHANFLVNMDEATCKEMLELIEYIKTQVREASGIDLHHEVRHINYEINQ